MDGQLKIIGIKIYDDCAPWIRKNLKPDTFYPFYTQWTESNSKLELKTNVSTIPENFFCENANSIRISISSLVGQNGSGKSALIDIALRLFNNLSCVLSEKYDHTHQFTFIPGVSASLYYAIGSQQFELKQKGDAATDLRLTNLNNDKEIPILKKRIGESFFYTILLNYSIHAFNIHDYKQEWFPRWSDGVKACWLDSVFHKNDGYKAPVVLNPMRIEGNIDINLENALAIDRLISLIFKRNGELNSSYTYINENVSISSIGITLDPNSVDKKFDDLFNWWEKEKVNYDPEMKDMLFNCIHQYWREIFKFKKKGKDDIEYDTAVKYLVYKTIAIANRYDAFDNFHTLTPGHSYSLKDKEVWQFELQKLIVEMSKDKSHITQRLRQTLAFLLYRHYKSTGEEITLSVDSFSKIPMDRRINLKKWDWGMADIIPPHCFKTNIQVKNATTEEEYPFSQLSSGERQLAYVCATIIYHLKNLNSIPKNTHRVKYQHINLILDEIELYFHPKYQKDFVDHIINCINSADLDDILSVNILMITHSPFILSDIPKSNVLFLKGGRATYEMQENTFAANIHSLLRNGFFLGNGSIGTFALKTVNKLFGELHSGDLSEDIRKRILLVSEPLLRTQLLKLYNEQVRPISPDYEIIESLKKRIEILEQKLYMQSNDSDKA